MHGKDRVHIPTAEHRIENRAGALAKLAALAERQLVSDVAVEYVGHVVVAKTVIGVHVIGVLLEAMSALAWLAAASPYRP